jgi:serine/threonine-protein kinase
MAGPYPEERLRWIGSGPPTSWGDKTLEDSGTAVLHPPQEARPASVPPPVQLDGALEERPPSDARYRSVAPLGKGGVGDVTLVHDDHIGRDVALKRLSDDLKDRPRARRRFAREARLQAQLQHPSVVPVYDLDAALDGSPFFTMKRVRGTSLGDVLWSLRTDEAGAAQPFSRRRLLSALSQVCMAAHYAHERGVVHRDIKPDNIMLGDYGEVFLLDWGIAKVGEEDVSLEPERARPADRDQRYAKTRDGDVIGTVEYMAPEQTTGLQARVDRRADVYALGAILFEILTSQPLHPDDGSLQSMLDQIERGVEARPSVRAPGVEVPPELEQLCVTATQVDPDKRLATAKALHESIEAYLDGDRDLALRREAGARHAAMAEAKALEALAAVGDAETAGRGAALREVGQALALDPQNPRALRTLVELLTRPPRALPREVRSLKRAQDHQHLRRGGRLGAVGYSFAVAIGTGLYLTGMHSMAVFVPTVGLCALAALVGALLSWRPSYVGLFFMFLFGVGGTVCLSAFYSPHLVVPSMLCLHAGVYSLVHQRWLQLTFLGLTWLAWTGTVLAEVTGLFPDTVRIGAQGLLIPWPTAMRPPEVAVHLTLYVAITSVIFICGMVVGQLRKSYFDVDLQMLLQTWQLHQLVPDESRARSTPVA